MTRLHDEVRIEVVAPNGDNGVFDNFTSFSITNDITAPSEANFELGDDESFDTIGRFTEPGVVYKVYINDRLSLTGRVEFQNVPVNASQGSVIRFTVRTKLSDAKFSSAVVISTSNITLKTWLVALYNQLGLGEDDFIFDPAIARDITTGIKTDNKGFPQKVDPDTHFIGKAKVRPPETIYDAADRQLRKHGLMHWDAPNGKIVVTAPNDTQDAIYHLVCNRGKGSHLNNVLDINRTQDVSSIPSQIGVYGVAGFGKAFATTKIAGEVHDDDLIAAGFNRKVIILAGKSIKTTAHAEQAAHRELASRSKSKDTFVINTDGLSWWDGDANIPFGVDTVAEIKSDLAGGLEGSYYVHRVTLSRDASAGDNTQITVLKAGVWNLGHIL